MDATLRLVDCSVADIRRVLDRQWSSIKGDFDGVARRASWSNYFLVLDKAVDPASILAALAHCQPSRFVVTRFGVGSAPTARVGIIPLRLGKKELLACEVLEFSIPSVEFFPEGLSLLRQWMLPGVSNFTYIDAHLPPSVVESLVDLSDSLIFDSNRFSRLEELAPFVGPKSAVQDLAWICLSPLRDQVRQVFELPVMVHLRSSLNSVKLTFSRDGEANSNPGALLCGWFAARLGLQELQFTHGLFEGFSDILNRRIQIEVVDGKERALARSRVLSLGMEFYFDAPYQKKTVRILFSEDHIEAFVDVDGCFHLVRPRESFDLEHEFRNLYLIGESFANYPAAFSWGVRFQNVTI